MLPIIHLIRAGNETWVCFGSGFCGMLSVLMTRNLCHIAQYAAYMGAGAGTMLALLNRYRPRRRVDRSHVVVVTGCDSGLGYNMALRCQQLNMFVVAACLDLRSDGARQLSAALDPKCSLVLALDLCDSDSIGAAHEKVRALLANDRRLQLSALVNNAGQMCFGEFEWQTGDQIVQQVTVNLLGTMAMTHAFLPLCRAHKSRIITVTSHCSVEVRLLAMEIIHIEELIHSSSRLCPVWHRTRPARPDCASSLMPSASRQQNTVSMSSTSFPARSL